MAAKVPLRAVYDAESNVTGIAEFQTGEYTIVGYGGTGATSFTDNGIIYGNGTGTLSVTAAGTDGYFLYSNSGTPAWTNTVNCGTF
jgi:hypothetical protein